MGAEIKAGPGEDHHGRLWGVHDRRAALHHTLAAALQPAAAADTDAASLHMIAIVDCRQASCRSGSGNPYSFQIQEVGL